jgi:acetyl-CoA C-acetyltransferase
MVFDAVKWNRRVAIVGIGMTHFRSRRPDVNQVEMVNEAVRGALEDAELTPKDIDVNVFGNMELFEGVHHPDMWHVEGYGGYLTSGIRVTAGGTTGGAVGTAAVNLVASGVYDVAMAIAFEKQEEIVTTTTGITNASDPLWGKWISSGAIRAESAANMIGQFGSYAEEMATKLRIQVADNASRNPRAHLRKKLTAEEVMNSPYLVYPLRYLHMCPQSCGACCVIFASEEKAKKITKKPVWVKDHVRRSISIASPDTYLEGNERIEPYPMQVSAAHKLYKRNGITDPLKQLDLFEMYDPHVWWHMDWISLFLGVPQGENLKMIERGETARDGVFPINPSGGVIATNAIGATSLVRPAEAALQIRGDCGDYQVTKEVNTAMASCFGGGGVILWLLSKELN